MVSNWFDSTKPPLSTYLEEKQGVQGDFALVRCSSSASNIFEPSRITDIKKCVEFFNMGSGWFDTTEPPLSTYLEEKQGVQGDFALVRCSSSASNLLEPS